MVDTVRLQLAGQVHRLDRRLVLAGTSRVSRNQRLPIRTTNRSADVVLASRCVLLDLFVGEGVPDARLRAQAVELALVGLAVEPNLDPQVREILSSVDADLVEVRRVSELATLHSRTQLVAVLLAVDCGLEGLDDLFNEQIEEDLGVGILVRGLGDPVRFDLDTNVGFVAYVVGNAGDVQFASVAHRAWDWLVVGAFEAQDAAQNLGQVLGHGVTHVLAVMLC